MAPDPPRVFVDADVIIAGLRSTSGASHLLLRVGELGLLHMVTSEQVRVEVERNLTRMLPSALPAFRVLLELFEVVPDASEAMVARLRGQGHAKDLPILGSAVESSCGLLITFNVKDFKPKRDVVVERPSDFIARLRRRIEEASQPPE